MKAFPRPSVEPRFFKAHGQGNDYLVFDEGPGPSLSVPAVERICDRRRGVGADGVVVVGAAGADGAPFLRMFNPDGGEFERSGNGLRIAGVHLRRMRRTSGDECVVATVAGRARLDVRGPGKDGVYDVQAEMGRIEFPGGPPFVAPGWVAQGGKVPLPAGAGPDRLEAVPVSVGNPHAVLFAVSWEDADVDRLGPMVAAHEAFPAGANVQFANLPAGREMAIRIWERGVGRTASSGTSACAAVAAAVKTGLTAPGWCRVLMEGGPMEVEWRPGCEVRLRGPVEVVCTGALDADFLADDASGRLSGSLPAGGAAGRRSS